MRSKKNFFRKIFFCLRIRFGDTNRFRGSLSNTFFWPISKNFGLKLLESLGTRALTSWSREGSRCCWNSHLERLYACYEWHGAGNLGPLFGVNVRTHWQNSKIPDTFLFLERLYACYEWHSPGNEGPQFGPRYQLSGDIFKDFLQTTYLLLFF